MEMTVLDKVVETIRKHLPNIDVKLPLKSMDDIDTISSYFEEIEVDLSTGLGSGIPIDEDELDEAASVVTELIPNDNDDFVDIDKLNKRLMSQRLNQNSKD